MRKFLALDTASSEMRLVYTDLWAGQHERTEYRVTSERTGGHVLRNLPDFDGATVHGTAPDLYIRNAITGGHIPVWTEATAIGPTDKTPCPRAASPRRKCPLCAAG